MLSRAYSLLTIKSVDEDAREIVGIATTPEPDRIGDIVEPKGAEFKLPIPLLWQHNTREPVGHVTHAKVTAAGIEVRAKFAKIDEPGKLKDRLDEAWLSVKSGLVQGLSIGFSAIESTRIEQTYAYRFVKWLWLELSVVTIPANQDATITAVKSADAALIAATGQSDDVVVRKTPPAGGTDATKTVATRKTMSKKTIQEQIKEWEGTLSAKVAERDALFDKSADTGELPDEAQAQAYDEADKEVKRITEHLARLREREKEAVTTTSTVVKGATIDDGTASRGQRHTVTVKDNTPPGIGFARLAICKMLAYMSQGMQNPLEIAQKRWPDDRRVIDAIKTAVAAGTSVDSVWAGPLVYANNLADEFVEFLRPMTIVGKFGTNGIPSLHRVPFNVRIPTQTTGGSASWVGEGAPKPLTKFQFDSVTIPYTKVAAIAVITKELVRFSSPSAEALVRDQLAKAVVLRIDTDFIDPAKAVSSGVNPASITNGLTALSSAGTSADNVRTDIANLLEQYILNNVDPSGLVLIMPNTLAMVLSILVNDLGQREFPDMTLSGGRLLGIPVIASQYAASGASFGNMVIAVNAGDVALADDGQVDVSVSGEASLNMDDAPTNNSATPTATSVVSMFQTNSLAVLAERFIHWKKLRSTAVVYMDDVNWGAIGSPF